MQADPRIRVGSVVAAIPGNPLSTRWVVQEIRHNRYGGTEYYGRGLQAAFPEPMNTNEHRPPELLWEHWTEVVNLPAQDPRFAAQIKWLAAPAYQDTSYYELVKWNREWKPPAPAPEPAVLKPIAPETTPRPPAVLAGIDNEIKAAGYQIDRFGWAEIGDTIWLRADGKGHPHVVQSEITANIWALILKPILPPREPKGELYVEPWGQHGCVKTGLTPDHFLILSREEAITIIERLSKLTGYLKGHP